MSLIVYECQRADHGHEIRQFGATAQSLYDYFDGRDELAVFISNVNVGESNLDGLIVKNDAIIIVEFKDYEGELVARQNGDWTCNGKPIRGGSSGKTVFEQLKKNQQILRRVIAEQGYFNEVQRSDIKGIVVLSKLTGYENDFDRKNSSWVFVSDVDNIGNKMHEIISVDFIDRKSGCSKDVYIPEEDIFAFLRKLKIDERALVTDFSNTGSMPSDLFHKDSPHNGKHYSTATLLAKKTEEGIALQETINKIQTELKELHVSLQQQVNDKEAIILQQKADLLEAREEVLRAERRTLEFSSTNMQEIDTVTKSFLEREKVLLQEIERLHMQVEEKNHSMEEDIVEDLATKIIEEPISKLRFAKKEVTEKPIDVDDDSMDDDQLDLIEKTLDESMIVAGCAGSGKSVIAMHKAQQILDMGGDVIMIALTKSLCLFMNQGNMGRSLGSHFYYHWNWRNIGMPSADYIIVDEIQDFSRGEIQEFINSAKKCFFFFGDTAQSIYKFTEKQTLSIEQIAKMTGLEPLQLYNNYRLPKAVAQITQTYVGVDVNPYSEKIYQSKEKALPHIVPFVNIEEQADAIIKIAEKSNSPSIGILVPRNEQVIQLMQLLSEKNFVCEVKYGNGFNDENKNTLNFQTKLPKLMTYHSAKGLQFETVFLPLYEGAIDSESRKALYVAMTRTYRNLYVMYNNVLSSPLKEVDSKYYLKTL